MTKERKEQIKKLSNHGGSVNKDNVIIELLLEILDALDAKKK